MTLLTRYALELGELWPNRPAGAIAWTISSAWIALKDAGWLSVIALICIATLAVSSVANRHVRHL